MSRRPFLYKWLVSYFLPRGDGFSFGMGHQEFDSKTPLSSTSLNKIMEHIQKSEGLPSRPVILAVTPLHVPLWKRIVRVFL